MTRILVFALIAGLAATQSTAQLSSMSLSARLDRSGLKQSDINAMERAAERLFGGDRVLVGYRARWENPQTGSSGVVNLAEFDGTCVRLEHRVDVSGRSRDFRVATLRCRSEDGTWLLDIPPS